MSIEFHVEASSERVEAWSTRRLQFEPKGWQLEYRAALRRAIEALPEQSALLHAVYVTDLEEHCDAENVLFYNVGLAAFARKTRHGLRFERGSHVPECPVTLNRPALHYHRYAYGHEGPFERWIDDVVIATVRFQADTLKDPTAVWAATRSGRWTEAGTIPAHAPYGLRITVSSTGVEAVQIVKPLLDGLISGMAAYSGPRQHVIAERVAERLGVSAATVTALLASDASPSPLGPGEIVVPRGSGIQWQPPDDRCVATQLVMAPSPGRQVHAELLALRSGAM